MYYNHGSAFRTLALAAGLLAVPGLWAAQNGSHADNTGVNKRDRNANAPTADQGKNNMSDRELAAHVRREVVADKNLSTYGHNVKIIAQHGHVTLKGPVHSEEEKRAIEEHARKYAGDGNIDNQITVKQDRGR